MNDLIKRSDALEAIKRAPKFLHNEYLDSESSSITTVDIEFAINSIPAVPDQAARVVEFKDWQPLALARLGVMRDDMSDNEVDIVQNFLGVFEEPT